MNKILNNYKYKNFLFMGIDLVSPFENYIKSFAYKNKYKRLENTINDDQIGLPIPQALDIFKLLFKHIHTYQISSAKMEYIQKLLDNEDVNRLVWNNIISIPIIEGEINDDSYKLMKMELIYKINSIFNCISIHDDSNDSYKILSCDIKVDLNLDYEPYIPDVSEYNMDIVGNYLRIIKLDFTNLFTTKSYDLCDKFSKDLDNNLLKNKKCVETDILNRFQNHMILDSKDLGNTNLLCSLLNESNLFLNEKNLEYGIKLQYKLFESICKNMFYDRSENKVRSIFLETFIANDIIVYNKSLIYDKKETYEKLFNTYNYYIIKLQDILETIDISDQKKIFVGMYKNQLQKSRNKIQNILNDFKEV